MSLAYPVTMFIVRSFKFHNSPKPSFLLLSTEYNIDGSLSQFAHLDLRKAKVLSYKAIFIRQRATKDANVVGLHMISVYSFGLGVEC